LRADIENIVAERVAAEKSRSDGVPEGVIRLILTKGDGCVCSVIRRFAAEAEKARVAAEPEKTTA
jgi:hypothetical protein